MRGRNLSNVTFHTFAVRANDGGGGSFGDNRVDDSEIDG